MKAFKKWNHKNKPYLPLLENTVTAERRKGWRAALEWAKTQSGEHEFDDLTVQSYIYMENILDELGDS